MGGLGSTRWGWTSTKDTVECNRSIDINQLNGAGFLRPGYCGGWEWKHDGERVAWIQFRRDGNTLVLSYRVRQHGGEWRNVEQPTQIVWAACRFGGVRPYFVCPCIVNGITCARPKGMHRDTYERLQSAVLNAEILAQERLATVLARLQRRERRSERRTAGRPSKEFWR